MNKNLSVLFEIKWLLICIIICVSIGALSAAIQVTYFEQASSGKVALHDECLSWDEQCIGSCPDYEQCDCCLVKGPKIEPVGIRLKELIKEYSIIGTVLGLVSGLIIAQSTKNKH